MMLATGHMIGLAALAAAQTSAPPAPAPYPVREVLTAFATACSGVEHPAVAKASALAAGWRPLPAGDNGQLRKLVAIGKAQVAEGDPNITLLPGEEFSMTVAGRALALALSGIDFGSLRSYGCRMYDFSATAALSADDLEGWAVRKPRREDDDSLVKFIWEPGMKPGHHQMEISFVPQGALADTDIPLSGLVFVASAMEFVEQ
ncbi:hypothetical protein [Blastomonas sp.]|uniref:hypothetical protein n=1 Tax=Blastomonas sp. TaxID=1909299 RepID=UPI003592ECDC